ncbi:MAG: DivIVA domain-containing protein, partial [Clostridia bacterium]|nr:DivIVA domain-containing protein [Clostridia bacterium]
MADKNFRVPVFRRAIHGYSPEHVDAFITVVQEKYYSLVAENEKLKERISSVAAESKKRGVEDELRRHEIEEIGEKAERLLSEAKERADRLVREAEAEAECIRADAACERADADIYAEEAKAEALEMLKEREALLSRAKAVVSELREKLSEEYGNVLSTLDELGQVDHGKAATLFDRAEKTSRTEEETVFSPTESEHTAIPEDEVLPDVIPEKEEEPALTEPEPEEDTFSWERQEEAADDAEEDANEATDEEQVPEEENLDDITIPDFSPVFEDEEEPEEAVIREGFPFAFDENDSYREDGAPDEEDVQSEEDEEDGVAEEYEKYGEDEEEDEEEDEDEDEEFSDSIPDYINEYPDGEPSGILEDE